MKSKNIIIAFVLTALFLTVGCDSALFPRNGNGDNEEPDTTINGGAVPFVLCPCDEGKSVQYEDGSNIKGNAYLFKDFLPEERERELSEKHLGNSHWGSWIAIILDTKMGLVCFRISGFMLTDIGRICNFPDFAKNWDIPAEGLKIYFEGVKFPTCERKSYLQCCGIDASSEGGFYFGFDVVLTNLERK